MIIIVSVYGVLAAGGPTAIISKLDRYNSTCEWKIPNIKSSETNALVRIKNSETGEEISRSEIFNIHNRKDEALFKDTEKNSRSSVISQDSNFADDQILFPNKNSILLSDHGYNIVWRKNNNRKFVDVEYSLDLSLIHI